MHSEGFGNKTELNRRQTHASSVLTIWIWISAAAASVWECIIKQMSPAQYNDLLSDQLQFYLAVRLTNFVCEQFVARSLTFPQSYIHMNSAPSCQLPAASQGVSIKLVAQILA